VTAAYLTDVIGRKRTLILFAACSFFCRDFLLRLSYLEPSDARARVSPGILSLRIVQPMGAYFSELFPTSLRASGAGFAYNFRPRSGCFVSPTLVGYVSGHTSLGTAISIFGSGAYLVMILGVMFLPETRGKQLEA